MSNIVIDVKNVTKIFKIYHDKPTTLKDYILRAGKGNYSLFEALSNISFQVEKGDTIGIIGKNGSGKSTLLKLINRTLFPDKGNIKINGKVASLIELGAGFHPDMTGRENIYNNASIFGLSEKEIKKRLNSIIDFSELHEFIDNPVRTYSSGMYARLAFAVAIHVDADILLVDEILSVGDINFQAKCNNHILELQKKGVTIIIVSHDLGSITQLCDKALLLEHGKLIGYGKSNDIRKLYMKHMSDEYSDNMVQQENNIEEIEIIEEDIPDAYKEGISHWGNQQVIIRNVVLKDERNNVKNIFNTGETIIIEYDYFCRIDPDIVDPFIGIAISRVDGLHIYGSNTRIDNYEKIKLSSKGKVTIKLKNVMLMKNEYEIDLAIEDKNGISYDYIKNIARFYITSNIDDVGIMRVEHEFIVK